MFSWILLLGLILGILPDLSWASNPIYDLKGQFTLQTQHGWKVLLVAQELRPHKLVISRSEDGPTAFRLTDGVLSSEGGLVAAFPHIPSYPPPLLPVYFSDFAIRRLTFSANATTGDDDQKSLVLETSRACKCIEWLIGMWMLMSGFSSRGQWFFRRCGCLFKV